MTKNAADLWSPSRPRISYSHSTMTTDEGMQRESSLIATIRKKLPEFAKACADDTELCCFTKTPLLPTTKRTHTRSSAWRKCAGLRGKEVRVIGKNRNSLGEGRRIQ